MYIISYVEYKYGLIMMNQFFQVFFKIINNLEPEIGIINLLHVIFAGFSSVFPC